jgi:hypothetical protein
MDEGQEKYMEPRHAFLWIGVPMAAIGLYFATTDAPLGWIFVALGAMLVLAGLVGIAVNDGGDERSPRPVKRRPWDDR